MMMMALALPTPSVAGAGATAAALAVAVVDAQPAGRDLAAALAVVVDACVLPSEDGEEEDGVSSE